MKTAYTDLDFWIVESIRTGCTTASRILEHSLVSSHAEHFATFKSPPFRVLDRRLQALRKKGVIVHSLLPGKTICGWMVAKRDAQ